MAGISVHHLNSVFRGFGRLDFTARAGILAGTALIVGGLSWAALDLAEAAQLVRLAPDTLPSQPQLMRFGESRGGRLYEAHCSGCHGSDGAGHFGRGVPNLTDRDWLYGEGKVSDIETVVRFGIRAPSSRSWRLADMPAFARPTPYPREKALQPLTPGDIKDVIQFLRLVEHRPVDLAAAGRGGAIFAGRGGCYDCHGTDARGDSAVGAPDLTDDIWLYGDGSDLSLFRSIAYGRAGVCPAWVDTLSPVKIREISLYVYSLSHGGAPPKRSQK